MSRASYERYPHLRRQAVRRREAMEARLWRGLKDVDRRILAGETNLADMRETIVDDLQKLWERPL